MATNKNMTSELESTPQEEEPSTSSQYHFVCIPYLNMGKTPQIDFGFAKIWNFDLLQEQYIPNPKLRTQVARSLASYKISYPYAHSTGAPGREIYHPVRGIGMLYTDALNTEPLDFDAQQKINDARLILFMSFVSQNNTLTRNVNSGHWMGSSDNFAPVFFTTVIGSEYVTEISGFVVQTWHGGIDIDKNMKIRPWHVPKAELRLDQTLLDALIELRSKRPRIFRRLISAVEVFYESFYNAPEVSHNARILLQASSFEILLGAPTGQGRKALKSYLKKVATYPEDPIIKYRSERASGSIIETGTVTEKWADKFFTLRNHILHGDVPASKEYNFGKWQRHFDIALYFFVLCLKRMVEKGLKRDIFGDDIVWKSWTDELSLPVMKYTGFEYTSLGRGWMRRMSRRLSSK